MTVYDSNYNGDKLHPSLTHQLALIYRALITEEEDGEDVDPHLAVHIPPTQQQNGGSDCGIYAIAFALHAALGDDVKVLEFDQPQIRAHLLNCFRKKELTRILTIKKCTGRSNHFPHQEIELYCSCLMPETYGDMVQCDKCELWYHIRCVGLASLPVDTEFWNCRSCLFH